jgi:hypothetical protein
MQNTRIKKDLSLVDDHVDVTKMVDDAENHQILMQVTFHSCEM